MPSIPSTRLPFTTTPSFWSNSIFFSTPRAYPPPALPEPAGAVDNISQQKTLNSVSLKEPNKSRVSPKAFFIEELFF
jgi:hypothetical protein